MGVIGAEIAASARKSGCVVIAIEPGPAPMVRSLGHRFGAWLARQHAAHGVEQRFGVGVVRLITASGIVTAVELDDGTTVDCDAVVVGIGIVPAVELARDAGLDLGNGILVDRQARTSHAHVFAAGDVADQPSFFGGRVRMETYQNAAEQAAAAAQAMLGQPADYLKPGWFWSDQYDLNIQGTGRLDETLDIVVRGDMESNAFSAFFLNEGVVEGMLTINRAAEMGIGRRMVERRLKADAAALADESVQLRALLSARPAAA
jgi:3-phenylpropionate/trans-cinnamate dioxygenase ferredoxin reductase subunit